MIAFTPEPHLAGSTYGRVMGIGAPIAMLVVVLVVVLVLVSAVVIVAWADVVLVALVVAVVVESVVGVDVQPIVSAASDTVPVRRPTVPMKELCASGPSRIQ
jgi:hypothetical protein